jgi:hypothetical protein
MHGVAMTTDYTLELARKYLGDYEGQYDEIMARHAEAMECRDCEDLLEHGLNAFQWLRRAEEVLRQTARAGICKTPEDNQSIRDGHEALNGLFSEWLRPCQHTEERIAQQEKLGFTPARAEEFRSACEYVRRRVRKVELHEELEQAFSGDVFDDSFWGEASRMRSS